MNQSHPKVVTVFLGIATAIMCFAGTASFGAAQERVEPTAAHHVAVEAEALSQSMSQISGELLR